ncbi:nucleotidyltransferase domain-containing protein [Mesobacillus selenatarsenatis]|uniref:Conserved domain protein n=1 Tax=Mesobacillus selenatarsenatis (strain DSM 18680 / JCM 14380 / FERM P-15431 / SF-1) TaxID=1321606 RepID=A0A0A8X0K2_MESS1|nr:nucleotidyltransferase domain-containing protein [Mesobacillus selenatarsenatis]GAM13510.1 conserved domain protein [Mesobacillus selenatarsenatis SF-1]
MNTRLSALETAQKFVKERFPDCDAALLAGSVTRGEATVTSDLDIVIFDKDIPSAYRESLVAYGWPIEVFVHNLHSYKLFFESDVKRARPSLPRMVAEGIVIKKSDFLPEINDEAKRIIKLGPEEWTKKEIESKRYFITDTLDDFIGTNNKAEELFIAGALAEQLQEFVLRTNKRWVGKSKWVVRELNHYDPVFTGKFVEAFSQYYKTGNKKMVVDMAELVLEPYGGRLFDGFSIK